MWLFNRHKWIYENRISQEHSMVWYLRQCKCGTVEIQHAGGTGDKKWHPFDGSFKFVWEQEWFEQAV